MVHCPIAFDKIQIINFIFRLAHAKNPNPIPS